MNDVPDWLIAVPTFDAQRDWLPIVCRGSRAIPHKITLIGAYFDSGNGVGRFAWAWCGMPDDPGPRGGRSHIVATAQNVRPVVSAEGRAVGSVNEGPGSIETSCPSCNLTHRVRRRDWNAYLEGARNEGLPFVDVSPLP